MPSDHGVGLDEDERGAPIPPGVCQYDPKQALSGSEPRTARRTFQCGELLAKREVLEDQFAMSAAGQRNPADQHKDHAQHASILPLWARPINRRGPVLILANDNVPKGAEEATRQGVAAWQRLQTQVRELAELNKERNLRNAREAESS